MAVVIKTKKETIIFLDKKFRSEEIVKFAEENLKNEIEFNWLTEEWHYKMKTNGSIRLQTGKASHFNKGDEIIVFPSCDCFEIISSFSSCLKKSIKDFIKSFQYFITN